MTNDILLRPHIEASVKIIEKKINSFKPKALIILGSGLGELAEKIHDSIVIPYSDLKGFPEVTVEGHFGNLIFGHLNGEAVVCMQGRQHFYEGKGFDGLKVALRTIKALGCNNLILTCAAGSLNDTFAPGSIMVIEDHINFMGTNPLIGINDDQIGVRFPSLDEAWDAELRHKLLQTAEQVKIDVGIGIYAAVSGPSFETPAEVRMLRQLGIDAVGMSTVPDCIIAKHCGYRVVGAAAITNYGVGMTDEKVNHDQTLALGSQISVNMTRLVATFMSKI